MNKETYTVTCINKHTNDISLSELEEILEYNSCPTCAASIDNVDPAELDVECPTCTWQETNNWNDIMGWFYVGCPRCSNNEFESHVHLTGSFYFETELYENVFERVNTQPYKRNERPDHWEIVTHFCERNELISILKNDEIKAFKTGYYSEEAVCLTEIPIAFSDEIRTTHGNYGIAFRKKTIIENGGQPIIHLTDKLIKAQESGSGFVDELKPFVQLLRIPSTAPTQKKSKKVDFLHEREWRVANNIHLNAIKPIGLILPKGSTMKKFSGNNWDLLLKNAFYYGEILD